MNSRETNEFLFLRMKYPQNVLRALQKAKWTTGYEGRISRNITNVEVKPSCIKQKYKIQPEDIGHGSTVHTGMIASLVDSSTTTVAIFTRQKIAGVTMDLSITNFVPIDTKTENELVIVSEMEFINDKMCHIISKIYSSDEETLFAVGRQTKFMHPGSRQPLKNVNLDDENLNVDNIKP